MATLNLSSIRKMHSVTPIIKKKTCSKRSYTQKERQKVVYDCLYMNAKEKRAYGEKKGYELKTINYFLYQYRVGNQ